MASNATVALVYVETYESIVRFLAQQKPSRLRSWCMEKSVQSNGHNWERLGTAEATAKSPVGGPTGRNVATPEDGYPFSRRRSTPGTWHTGDTTEQEDIVQVLIDPNSNIAQAQAYAMNRAIDDEILDSADRDADDGNGGVVAFPAAQIVGDGSTAITFDLTTQVTEVFMNNDIDPDEEKVMIISPAQARKLLQLTEATSGDYNAVRPLTSKGYIESWMGYTWIVSTRLNSPAADESHCLCMTRKALGLQMNKDVSTEVAKDPTISFAWRIYCNATFGGVRVEDEHIVRLHLSELI
jgi:hypothetical protein